MSTEPTIAYVLGDLCLGLKRTGSDANQSMSSNVEISKGWKLAPTFLFAYVGCLWAV